MSQHFTPDERETTITTTDGDEVVRIWTAQKSAIIRLRKHRSFTETDSGYYGSTEWAAFTIPADQWNPVTGAKRRARNFSDEERVQMSERLRQARESA